MKTNSEPPRGVAWKPVHLNSWSSPCLSRHVQHRTLGRESQFKGPGIVCGDAGLDTYRSREVAVHGNWPTHFHTSNNKSLLDSGTLGSISLNRCSLSVSSGPSKGPTRVSMRRCARAARLVPSAELYSYLCPLPTHGPRFSFQPDDLESFIASSLTNRAKPTRPMYHRLCPGRMPAMSLGRGPKIDT